MRVTPRRLMLIFLLLAFGRAMAETPSIPSVEIRLRHGDDPRWAEPDWPDADWTVVSRTDSLGRVTNNFAPSRAGVFWLRYRLELSDQINAGLDTPRYFCPADSIGGPTNSIFLAGPFCYEFFWDGRLIGRSGTVGSSYETEVPGPLDNLMLIPDSLLGPGLHVVAIRMSTYHYNFPQSSFRASPTMGNYAARLRYEARLPVVPLVGAGASLLVAALCGVFYGFVDRRRSLAIGGALAVTVAALYTLIAWRWLYDDPFTWLYPRYQAMMLVMALIGLLLNALLLEQLGLARKAWWLLGAVVVTVVVANYPVFHQVRAIYLGRALLTYALVIAAWGLWRRRPAAKVAFAGVLIGLGSIQQADDLRLVISPAFFLFFGMLVLILLASVGWQIRVDRQKTRIAQLAAARLETELLKKNIQPHFLLNTLAVLTEIVERDPTRAVKLIDDLADEFRTVARVAGEKLIPLAQEIDLCRAHLRVMSVRTGREWLLQAPAVDQRELVPPAVLLTLVENSFAHQRAAGTGGTFRLAVEPVATGGRRYVFFSPGEVHDDPARQAGGTGLRYVKARLEESFPGAWNFDNGAVPGGWQTTLEFYPAWQEVTS